MLTGLFLLAVLFAILLYAFTPETPASRGPILLASFIAILLGSLLCILFLLRWLLRPYHQLVGEAERASVANLRCSSRKTKRSLFSKPFNLSSRNCRNNEKSFEQLSEQARERASSAEKFSERIVASLAFGSDCFRWRGLAMAINTPGRTLLEVDGKALGESYEQLLGRYEELATMVGDCLQKGTLYRRTEIEVVTPDGGLPGVSAQRSRRLNCLRNERPKARFVCLTDITEVTELREQVALKEQPRESRRDVGGPGS